MKTILSVAIGLLGVTGLHADLITSVPNTFEHGHGGGHGTMYMPMIGVHYTGADTGSIVVVPDARIPLMKPLQQWSPGAWFEQSAPWRADLGSPTGVGGTPEANAGSGALFSNQYGFMIAGDSDFLEGNHSFAISLVSASEGLRAFNYVAGPSGFGQWDQVWEEGERVVWSTSMWHNYFVLPADAAPGIYTATFEIYLVDYLFTTGTGAADYSDEAQNAARVDGVASAYLTYQFQVIPEPSTWMLLGVAGVVLLAMRRRQAHARA